ncbi:fluoride efflux transporter CrcB [Glycomyces sp. NRRL B-16210]|uniref:fluoride efflux transporter CrcB n=1 Tax=Glycomyces sp. NRRL B-16210 TaxID=1463821 RepID=UPI0004BE9757|nr:fluoride efflux transporter CrcB [Glycomyces sp. NRRL B-16210]
MFNPRYRRREPIDPDLAVPARRREAERPHLAVLAAVALGGGIGATARYGASVAWPTAPDGFPFTTLLVNVLGCALIGVLMAVLAEARSAHRLARPFLGTGVLGGFTTFSTWALELQTLVEHGQARAALVYLLVTLAAALAAVWAAAGATRRLIAWRRR